MPKKKIQNKRKANLWAEASKYLVVELEKLKPKDRLGLCGAITTCNVALARSVNGWTSWLMDPRVMNTIDEEGLKDIFKEFQIISKRFLTLDIKVTEKYGSSNAESERQPEYIQ